MTTEQGIKDCFSMVVQADDDLDTAANRLHHYLGFPKEEVVEVLKRIWQFVVVG